MGGSREALPEATTTLKALQYVQGQAVRGHFDGQPTALSVLYCLVMNMWVNPSPDGQGRCEVMSGRSDIANIAARTALSRRSVQRALRWLGEAEWIDTERQTGEGGREVNRYIHVKLDAAGHRQRQDKLGQMRVSQ